MTPYEKLATLIEQELRLAGEGRFEDLAAATRARVEFVETLPPTPPASARDALQRASLIQQRLEIEVQRGREEVLLAIAEVQRARRAARGYTPHRKRIPQISASA